MYVLEDLHGVNIHLYELDENGKGYKTSRTPGSRAMYNKNIYIGKRDGNYYWITKNLTKKRYYCTKLPTKCVYYTEDLGNWIRHEATCTDETKITATQVT